MKSSVIHIISIFTFLFFASCNKKVSQEELIQTAVALKIDQWRELQINECKRKAIVDAEVYVDSILIIRSLPAKLDTIPKPPKPMKPPKPAFRPKPDSIVVKKLEED
jgi:hypothetical protein